MTKPFSDFGHDKPAFFYFYDALCGWCYGFSPVIQEVYQQYEGEIDFEVISGGMVTGDRVGPIDEVAGYIKDAYQTVEERTGVEFGPPFLEGILAEGKAVFTSVPAATAMAIVKEMAPGKQVPFAALLQQAIYFHGIRPAVAADYQPYAAQAGLDAEEFLVKMKDLSYRRSAEQEFNLTTQVGVRGFPTCFMKKGEQFYLITTGYQPLPDLLIAIQKVLGHHPVNPS